MAGLGQDAAQWCQNAYCREHNYPKCQPPGANTEFDEQSEAQDQANDVTDQKGGPKELLGDFGGSAMR